MDSGRKSRHGLVVLLYFDLCEQIWRDSPVTTVIVEGIAMTEINNSSRVSRKSPNSNDDSQTRN